MSIPLFLVLMGAFFLFYNSHWTFNFALNMGTFWPVASMLIGLIIMLKPRG